MDVDLNIWCVAFCGRFSTKPAAAMQDDKAAVGGAATPDIGLQLRGYMGSSSRLLWEFQDSFSPVTHETREDGVDAG